MPSGPYTNRMQNLGTAVVLLANHVSHLDPGGLTNAHTPRSKLTTLRAGHFSGKAQEQSHCGSTCCQGKRAATPLRRHVHQRRWQKPKGWGGQRLFSTQGYTNIMQLCMCVCVINQRCNCKRSKATVKESWPSRAQPCCIADKILTRGRMFDPRI